MDLKTLNSGYIEGYLQPRKPAVYPANAIIYTQGEQQPRIFFLSSGMVKLSFFDRHGREKVQGIVEPGAFFGEPGPFGSRPYGVTALTLRTSNVYAIPIEETQRWFHEKPELIMAILKSMADTIYQMGRQLCSAVFQDAEGCVATAILTVLERQLPPLGSSKHAVGMTQQALANNAGLSRVTISKVLHELSRQQIIRMRKGTIEVTNLKALRELARI